MAAGIGSRYGAGIKQLAKMGPNGEIIMDYSIRDAKEAGFNKVVFIIRKDIFEEFEEIIGSRIKDQIDVEYVFQELDDLPEGFEVPEGRTKPWGTGQAVLCCKDIVKEPFVIINADDYYGKEAFVKLHDFLVSGEDLGREFTMGMAGFILKNTLSDNGTVTRGVSVVDENGLLSQVHETTGIMMGERRRTDMKVGFIGGGNMASAMIGGMIQKGVVSADDILVSVRTEKSVERLTNQFGVQATMENEAVVAGSDLVFLAVKPNQIKNIINLVKNFISPEKIIVSILPGKSLQWLGTEIGKPTKLIRTMPNTPALVGEGMTGVCANDLVTEEELQLVLTLLKSFGRAEVVPEYLMDTVTGVSGSSPAYVFLFLEALADAAVAEGMPRKQAYEFAAQSVLGSAKMLLETGMHPGELKDMVCSPGGTTIEAVAVLERENLRSAVIDATRACIRKSKGVD